MERTPEKEMEVLARIERMVSRSGKLATWSKVDVLKLIEDCRHEYYRPEPREVWVKFDETGHPIVSREKRTNQSNPWSLFREVIETDVKEP